MEKLIVKNNYNYWTEREILYLKKNYKNLSIKELENVLNHTKGSIRKKKYEVLNLIQKQFPWSVKETDYLKNNFRWKYKDIILKNLNRNWNAIKLKASKLGLKRDNQTILPLNQDFFKNWNWDSAYILGFLCADGNLSSKRNLITFSSNDNQLIQLIKLKLKSEHKIQGPYKNNYVLQIGNKIMYNDLLKLGITPRKSLTLQFPEVPYKYLSHFIRGEFDGDGSFWASNINKKYNYLNAEITGNIDFPKVLENKLEEIGIDSTSLRQSHKNKSNHSNKIYQLRYFNKESIKFGDFIYQKSENLRLERKFEIYEKMKKEFTKKLEYKNER